MSRYYSSDPLRDAENWLADQQRADEAAEFAREHCMHCDRPSWPNVCPACGLGVCERCSEQHRTWFNDGRCAGDEYVVHLYDEDHFDSAPGTHDSFGCCDARTRGVAA